MSYFWGTLTSVGEQASEAVRSYRAERERRLGVAQAYCKNTLVSASVMDSAKQGKLTTEMKVNEIDFEKAEPKTLKEYQFNAEEVDKLIATIVEYAEAENISHSVEGQTVTLTVEDPVAADKRREEEAKKAEEEAKAKEEEEKEEETESSE